MRFSERQGFKPVRQALQIDSIDEPLLNCLWNAVDSTILAGAHYGAYGEFQQYSFFDFLWTEYYKKRIDQEPEQSHLIRTYIANRIFEGPWYEIYDFIEFALENFAFDIMPPDAQSKKDFITQCNVLLEQEMSAYRIVADKFVRIISEEELGAIETATKSEDRYAPVATHIRRALELLSDRRKPDYRNSIKESISAVESICAIITCNPKATLGDALKHLTASGVNIHPALREAYNKMYGYTSDAQGIRHALLDEQALDLADAKFMLVSCSAFVNLLKARSA